MNKRSLFAIGLMSVLLTGCGLTPPATESEMKEAASFALNVDANKVTISNVDKKGGKTNFIATVGNTTHRCYVTKITGKLYGIIPIGQQDTVSDAICSGAGTGTGANSKTCDALSKQAGRC